MALKKSQLYSSLWRSCDELRGGMDASQYKDYVLTLLFMKYVSDRHAGRPDALIDVPAGGGFADIAALKGRKDIGERINTIIAAFAKANDLQGVIDQADFDDDSKLGSGKEMQDRLSKLVAIFEGLDFRANRAGGDDLLGDAYEYLMRHFATESGKSKGQFYTPAEVSRVIAQVVGIGPDTRQDQTIYDPTCGSGSLLLKAADQAPGGITVYGQEMDNATWALARMNMILHGHETADVRRGNTLAAPHFKSPGGGLKTFDFAVANPPFSAKAWSTGLDPAHDEFGRFEHGIPPARNGDYAFLLHLIASLKSRGKGAIILPHGVLFRGNREVDIRRNLVRRGLVKGIIGLPPNLFVGLLSSEPAGDDEWRRNEIHLVASALDGEVGCFRDLSMLVLDGGAGFGGVDPSVGDDEVHIVLHHVVPVVHEPLVHVVGADHRDVGEAGEEVLGQRVDDGGGDVVSGEALEDRAVHVAPHVEDFRHVLAVFLDLGVVADSRVDRGRGDAEPAVPGAAGALEERGAERREDVPPGAQSVEVAVGDAAVEVRVEVVQVLELARVHVAGNVQVVVVGGVGDLGHRHDARVPRHVGLAVEHIDDAVDVLGAQAVLVPVLAEAAAGVDQEDALADVGVLLVDDEDAGGDARPVE